MTLGHVAEIWRYPVKSMIGERVASAHLGDKLPGDRGFGVFDLDSGHLLSGKTVPALLSIAARWLDPAVEIELPDGRTSRSDDPAVHELLSEHLGRRVELRAGVEGESATVAIELDDGSGPDDAARDHFEFPTRPNGSFFDGSSSIHIVSRATLAALDEAGGSRAGDARRYRPNLIVDGCDAFAEDGWVDQTITVGRAQLLVRKRTDRCVMVGRPQGDLPRDRAILRHIVQTRESAIGVNCNPETPGNLTEGDPITA